MFFVVGKHAKKRSRVALVRRSGAPIAELGQDGRFLASSVSLIVKVHDADERCLEDGTPMVPISWNLTGDT